MDALTRTLLLEVARAVLRVLESKAALAETAAQPTPWGTASNPEADRGKPKAAPAPVPPAPPVAAGGHGRGDVVRFWDGNRYAIGTVQNICRKKDGHPAAITVRVERGEGRKGKTHKVEAAKCEVIKGGAA